MKNHPLTLALLLGLVGLASCTVGPNYQKPSTADLTPNQWRNPTPTTHAATTQAPALRSAWWEIFGDKELDTLEVRALASNQDLVAAVARIEQSRSTARQTASNFYPQLQGSASFTRARTNLLGQGTTGNTYSVPFDLSYEVDLWGKIRRSFESATAQVQVSQAEAQFVQLALTSDVATSYFQIRTLDSQAALLRRTVQLRQETVETLQQRFKAGTIAEIDLSRAQTDLATAQADLAAVQRERAQTQNTLAVLCGAAASDFAVAEKSLSTTAPEIPAGLPSELLQRRPDVAGAEQTLVARNAEIGVAIAGYFPSVSLTASGGTMSIDAKSVFNASSGVWAFGPSVTVPLFTGGRTAAEVARSKAGYTESVARYKQTILGAFRDVEDALAAAYYWGQQQAAYRDAETAARRVTELARFRYERGVVSNLEVIDAERTQLQVELLARRAEGQRVAAAVQLTRALGGGWDAHR
jgi:outer membrane protein, multidrug efflux system